MSVWSRGCFCGEVQVEKGEVRMGEEREREREKEGDEQRKEEVPQVMSASHMG